MRLVDWRPVFTLFGVAVLGCACCAFASAADKPGYGKVDTFEPGKKYSCVPTADHKGWDCTQNGKAPDASPPAATREPPAAAPSATVAPSAPAASVPASAAPVSSAAPAASAPAAAHSGELPSYLSARAASGAPPPQQPMPAPAPAARANVSTNPQVASSPAPREESKTAAPPTEAATAPVSTPSAAPSTSAAATPAKPTPASEPAPVAAPATPKTAISEKPETAPTPAPQAAAPAQAEPVRPATAPATPARSAISTRSSNIAALGSDAFLALSGEQYVIELAHAASEGGLPTPPPLPRGEVYKLHLQQNGADVWLLLWGSFDDVSAARAARAELAASAAQTPGWPRRVAPLQAEARRARD